MPAHVEPLNESTTITRVVGTMMHLVVILSKCLPALCPFCKISLYYNCWKCWSVTVVTGKHLVEWKITEGRDKNPANLCNLIHHLPALPKTGLCGFRPLGRTVSRVCTQNCGPKHSSKGLLGTMASSNSQQQYDIKTTQDDMSLLQNKVANNTWSYLFLR